MPLEQLLWQDASRGRATINEAELFQAALGLAPPWVVERCEFSVEPGRLDIYLDFPRGSDFACPECAAASKAYDTDELTWRHLNFFQHETRQKNTLATLNLPRGYLKTAKAYQIRLAFQGPYLPPHEDAKKFPGKWFFRATHSRIQPIIKVARTIRAHQDGILRWFTSKISNGILEGINSLVQAAKAKARGYRSNRNFANIIYLVAGKLDLSCQPT